MPRVQFKFEEIKAARNKDNGKQVGGSWLDLLQGLLPVLPPCQISSSCLAPMIARARGEN